MLDEELTLAKNTKFAKGIQHPAPSIENPAPSYYWLDGLFIRSFNAEPDFFQFLELQIK